MQPAKIEKSTFFNFFPNRDQCSIFVKQVKQAVSAIFQKPVWYNSGEVDKRGAVFTMAKLHPILNDTRGHVWCGPGAIAAITGKPLSQVKEAIYGVRGKRSPIMGMSEIEVAHTLRALGLRPAPARKYSKDERPTLARWLRERYKFQMGKTYLVNITDHFVVIRGRKFIDNQTLEPVFIRSAPKRRARVKSVRAVA